ncbi:MAG: DUF2155 domain-containing protein [Pseudomonadota bacterium]
MRIAFVSVAATLSLALASCGQGADGTENSAGLQQTAQGEGEQRVGEPPGEVGEAGATPLEERVATIGLLNKRNNLTQDFEMRPGEVREAGPVILRLASCERTAPWEMPQETGAFVQLDVLERGESEHTRVFSGWLFKDSPSLNVVEHPIYDVWVKDCAMRFPGEPAEAG